MTRNHHLHSGFLVQMDFISSLSSLDHSAVNHLTVICKLAHQRSGHAGSDK